MIKRPSSKELYDRIRQARRIVDDGPIYLVEDEPIIADALDLGYEIAEIPRVLKRLLDEIGVGGERLEMITMSAGMGERFAVTASEFTEKIRSLGPNPVKGRAKAGQKAAAG